MGDMSDYHTSLYPCYLQEYEAEEKIEDYKMGVAEWETKEGNNILVQNMTFNHIENTLKYLKNKKVQTPWYDAWIYIFECELKKRPDPKPSFH